MNKTSQGDAIETFGLKIAGLADAFVEMFHHKECTKWLFRSLLLWLHARVKLCWHVLKKIKKINKNTKITKAAVPRAQSVISSKLSKRLVS